MKFYEKLSLKWKLIGMVVTVNLLLAGGGLFSMNRMEHHYRDEVTKGFSSAADSAAGEIQSQFYERYGDVQAFAVNRSIQSMNEKLVQADLDRYVELYGIYQVILVVDSQGRFIASNTKDPQGRAVRQNELRQIDYNSAPWFRAAIKGEFTEDENLGFRGTLFEEPHLDPVLKVAFGDAFVSTSFTTTIKDPNGRVIGVITNRASPSWYEDILAETHKDILEAGAKDAEVSLLGAKLLAYAEVRTVANKSQIQSDPKEHFLKSDFSKSEAAQKALTGNSGAIDAKDPDDGEIDTVGYAAFNGKKWPSQLKWTVLVHDSLEDAMHEVRKAHTEFLVILGVCSLVSLAFALFFSLSLSRKVSSLASVLGVNSTDLASASGRVAASSTQLSAGSTEQAAALQETVAAVDEISAMVDKNAESANRSKEASANSRDAALRGRQSVDTMIQAIDEISHSNDEVSNQMAESNARLAEITKLINDIGSKTKVINEIVFQTKLLSFNASVEAARAGEYGKGFAVVAEEVGNLAQMSGNAAKEITTLLEESVRKVEGIVSESRSRVDRLVAESKTKVAVGSDTARACNEALEEILSQVSSVDTLVSEIAVASQEQSTGIREIAKAVGQMEEVTQQNSSVAEDSSAAAEQLNAQSTQLKEVVSSLLDIVHGLGAGAATEKSAAAKASDKALKKSSVLKFAKKKSSTKTSEHREAPQTFSKVSGDDFPPSSDDPGFGE